MCLPIISLRKMRLFRAVLSAGSPGGSFGLCNDFLITLCTPREVGVNLKQGYNGDLTAKQAGSIGGQMVNNICPVRHMKFTRNYRWITGHEKQLTYSFRLTV